MRPIAPQFTFDVTTERPRDDHGLAEVIAYMTKQAEGYLAAYPDAEAFAIRLTVIPISEDPE